MVDGEIYDDSDVPIKQIIAVFAELEQNFVNFLPKILMVEDRHQILEHFIAELYFFDENISEKLNTVSQSRKR
jgi:hypothetical protein